MQDRASSEAMAFYFQRLSSVLVWVDSLKFAGTKIFVTTARIDKCAIALLDFIRSVVDLSLRSEMMKATDPAITLDNARAYNLFAQDAVRLFDWQGTRCFICSCQNELG